MTLKPYWLPISPRRCLSLDTPQQSIPRGPLYTGDTDFIALRPLIRELNPALSAPFELMLQYFQTLDEAAGPSLQILSVDCVDQRSNRLKVGSFRGPHTHPCLSPPLQIYFRIMNRMSLSTVKHTFTLGGRLSSPVLSSSLLRLEMLWHLLFRTVDLSTASLGPQPGGRPHPSHPNTGLLFYFELLPGSDTIFPKVYLPVR